jgi:hypothetical protein
MAAKTVFDRADKPKWPDVAADGDWLFISDAAPASPSPRIDDSTLGGGYGLPYAPSMSAAALGDGERYGAFYGPENVCVGAPQGTPSGPFGFYARRNAVEARGWVAKPAIGWVWQPGNRWLAMNVTPGTPAAVSLDDYFAEEYRACPGTWWLPVHEIPDDGTVVYRDAGGVLHEDIVGPVKIVGDARVHLTMPVGDASCFSGHPGEARIGVLPPGVLERLVEDPSIP